MSEIITSLQNQRIKFARTLRTRNKREKSGLTLLEGYRAVSRSLECGIEFQECFFSPALFLGKNEKPLLAKIAETGAEVTEVTEDVIKKIAYRDRPEGIIAVVKSKKHTLDEIPVKENGLYIIAESIEKPGNLGSILRSADAAAVDGVIVCDKCTDIYNPNVITASTGALFSVNIAEATAEETLVWLKKHKISTLAATPEAEEIYYNTDLTGKVAVVVGTEQYGLTDFWKNSADINVKIPMLGYIDSLNVATATTVILFETARQRAQK
jgi:TrmH family RNA methyltransferase